MVTRLLSVGWVAFFLLGSNDPPHVIEVEHDDPRVEVEECHLASIKSYRTGEDKVTEICSPLSTLVKRSGAMFKLRLRVSVRSKPLAGVPLELVICDPRSCGLLVRRHGSLTGITDAAGEIVFDNLFLKRDVPLDTYLLAYVFEQSEEKPTYARWLPVHGEPTKITASSHTIIETYPPMSQWSLSYDGYIPAGATVRWYTKYTKKNIVNEQTLVVSSEEKFTTDKTTRKLLIAKEAFSCNDFSREGNYHELYVSITTPSFSLVKISAHKGSGCRIHPPPQIPHSN